jgi:predicted small metal-binding protein
MRVHRYFLGFMGLLRCKDLGMNCSFTATGTTEQDIMRQFIEHAESAHKMSVFSADFMYRVQKAIKK